MAGQPDSSGVLASAVGLAATSLETASHFAGSFALPHGFRSLPLLFERCDVSDLRCSFGMLA